MAVDNKETTEKLLVPRGEGAIIGDLLRKFTVKCRTSWQPIAYYTNTTAENFGFSNGSKSNYSQLLKGKIIYTGDRETAKIGTVKTLDFRWEGDCYVNGPMKLVGVSRDVGESIKVVVLFASGNRTELQNAELIRKVTPNSGEGYYTISSSHSGMKDIKFKIEPEDSAHEWLVITANMDKVKEATSQIVLTLSSLNL